MWLGIEAVIIMQQQFNQTQQTSEQEHEIQVNVFPNPSFNTFTISFNNLEQASEIEIKIEDISSRAVYETRRYNLTEGKNFQVIWNADKVNAGIYLYSIRVNGMKIKAGKMFKM